LSDKLLNELAEKFEQHGAAAMDVVAKRMPEKFLALAFGILPRDVLIEVVEQRRPGGLDAAEWELMLRVLDLIKANVPADANASPSEVFGVIEEALRARYAKPVTDVRENNPNKE
jgi:hypothetical protein